jgi:alkylation response protein AidB-like acyl-CoA dehydrogenase
MGAFCRPALGYYLTNCREGDVDHVFSDEQRMLRDSVERLVAERYSFERRKAIVASGPGYSAEMWREVAGLGLLAAPFAEEHGGLGGGALETLIVMQAFGRGIIVEPYLPTVVLAGSLLRHGGSAAQKAAMIPRIAAGEALYAFAFAEPQGRYNPANVRTTARASGAGYRIDGFKSVVYGAPMAEGVFVTARTSGAQSDASGLTVFYVDAKARGLTRRDFRTIDEQRASEIELAGVEVGRDAVVGTVDNALPLIERVLDEGAAALCAEAAGAMAVLNDKTLNYARQRQAFGQSIGSFQVVQHRLVDMRVACEYANAMALMAALKLNAPAAERRRAVSAAKAMIGRDSRFVGHNAIHLHGAIGMTDDLDIGHYFKRLTAIGYLLGNADYHTRRFWREWRGAQETPAVAQEAA